jgi:hypothetical protein
MRTTLLAAFFAVLLTLPAAFAVEIRVDAVLVPAPSSGESMSVGEPFVPGGGETNSGDRPMLKEQSGPKAPQGLPAILAGRSDCEDGLGHLRQVRASDIREVAGLVQVAPVCPRQNLRDQQKGVANIRSAVQRNDAMRVALRQAGYAADDVVGVVLDGRGALLYVHAR